MASNNTSMSTLNHQLIPEFDGEDYDFWYVKMKTIFRSLNQWEIVEKGIEEPVDTTNLNRTELKTLELARQADASALSIIQRAVTKTIFPRIMRANTAKEAWEILQSEFQGDAKIRAIKLQSLRKELENVKMKEKETLMEFSTRFLDLVNQMKSLGEDVADKRMVEKILISLPEKFDPIVAVIEETKDLSTLTVQEVMASLKSFEQRLFRHDEKPIEGAFQSKINFKNKNRSYGHNSTHSESHKRGWNTERRGRYHTSTFCNICKRSNHVEEDCWFKDKPKCNRCNRFGHLEKDCRVREVHQVNSVETQEEEMTHGTFYACHTAETKNNEKWLLDSGCTNHMTSNQNIFSEINNKVTKPIQLGNGEFVESKGIGSIPINTKDGPSFIPNVLCVPSLSQNLLSLGQMLENGYKLIFDKDECTIYDKRNKSKVFTKIKMVNRSFTLNISYAEAIALRATTTTKEVKEKPTLPNAKVSKMNESKNFDEIVKEEACLRAKKKEIQVINNEETWKPITNPNEKEVNGVKRIYKVKNNPDGLIQRNKTKLTFKGFSQQTEIKEKEDKVNKSKKAKHKLSSFVWKEKFPTYSSKAPKESFSTTSNRTMNPTTH